MSDNPVDHAERDTQIVLLAYDDPSLLRPTKLGGTSVQYIKSGSVFNHATGFIKAYDFTLNPYSGCSFGCDYCYARFFARTEDERDAWGSWVKVKENAVQRIEKAKRSRGKHPLEPGSSIYMSTVTDPYQPIEQKLGLTRRILEALIDVQPRLTIQTRSPIVTRDIDLLQQFDHVRVNVTVTTDSDVVRKRYEPQCPSIRVRLRTLERLVAAGIPVGVSVSPMLPIADVQAFGQRIADFDAAEYVTQYLHPVRSRFVAGSTKVAMEKMRADDWTEGRYADARDQLRVILGLNRPLLEGEEGFLPPVCDPGDCARAGGAALKP